MILAVSLPVGASRISSRGYDPLIKLRWSKELKGGWSIGGMQSLFSNTDGGTRNVVWKPTFYIETEITKPWQAFAEYAGDFAQRGGQRRSRTLARRTGSPRGNRWIFTSGSAYPAQRRAISLRSDIRSASIDYGGASFRCYRRKPKHRLLAKSPRR